MRTQLVLLNIRNNRAARCCLPACYASHEPQTCGATHSHAPPTTFAWKGLAGSPLVAMIGQPVVVMVRVCACEGAARGGVAFYG
jgi:hypothetical protein